MQYFIELNQKEAVPVTIRSLNNGSYQVRIGFLSSSFGIPGELPSVYYRAPIEHLSFSCVIPINVLTT